MKAFASLLLLAASAAAQTYNVSYHLGNVRVFSGPNESNTGRVAWSHLTATGKIAYDKHNSAGWYDTYIANVDGSSPFCVTCTSYMSTALPNSSGVHYYVGNPVFSPSDTYLICQVMEYPQGDGSPGANNADALGSGYWQGLWALKLDGSNAIKLTTISPTTGGTIHPVFNHAGNKLLYGWRLAVTPAGYETFSLRINNYSEPGGVPTLGSSIINPVNGTADFLPGDTTSNYRESGGWSLDDTIVGFMGNIGLDAEGHTYGQFDMNLYTMVVSTGVATNLTNDSHVPHTDWWEFWRPNPVKPNLIAYMTTSSSSTTSQTQLRCDIWIADYSMVHRRQLTFFNTPNAEFQPDGVCMADPEWSPDGNSLIIYGNLGRGPAYPGYILMANLIPDSNVGYALPQRAGKLNPTGKHIVAPASTAFTQAVKAIMGPQIAMGNNPWPYFDATTAAAADYFAGLQRDPCQPTPVGGSLVAAATGCYTPYWNTAYASATVTATNGSSTYTFSGVNTQTLFGCTPSTGGTTFVSVDVWYNAGANRFPVGIASCPTTSTITSNIAWPRATETGLSFNTVTNFQDGAVEAASGSAINMNYYDLVVFFYSTWQRTGNSEYLIAARNLADMWYTQPFIDQGQAVLDGIGNRILHPRVAAITGLVLRALDGKPSYWTGIEALNSYYHNFAMGSTTIYDVREAGYAQYFLALQMMFDPNTSGANCGSTTCAGFARSEYDANLTNTWSGAQQTSGVNSGVWQNIFYGTAPWNGNTMPAITLTNGSATVTTAADTASIFGQCSAPGTGQSGCYDPTNQNLWAWFLANSPCNPASNADGDPTAYHPTYVNSTSFTLDRVYAGTSKTTSCWQFGLNVGFGTQPYMLGMPFRAFDLGVQAGDSNATLLTSWLQNIVTYWQTVGYKATALNTDGGTSTSAARGLWYATGTASYNANGHGHYDEDQGVYGSGIDAIGSRGLAPEIMWSLARAQQLFPSSALHAFADNLYDAQWYGPSNGCQTGTNAGPLSGSGFADGDYVNNLVLVNTSGTCGYNYQPNPKWPGFFDGFGGGHLWPAVR